MRGFPHFFWLKNLMRCSTGTLQFLINRMTQLLTLTSEYPISNCPWEEARYHLENLAGFKRQVSFLRITKVECSCSEFWLSFSSSCLESWFFRSGLRSALTSVKASSFGFAAFGLGQSLSGNAKKVGPFHHISLSANSETVSPLVPKSAGFCFVGT